MDVPDIARTDGYSRFSIVVHWIAAMIVIVLFVTHEGAGVRGSTDYVIHVSGGAVAGVFLLWRAWRRIRRGMTEKPDQAFVLNVASRIVIWGFVAAIVVVVVSGYLLPWSTGRSLDIFGLIAIPSPTGSSPGFRSFLEVVHEISGDLFVPLVTRI